MISAIKIRAEIISYATSRYTYESCSVCGVSERSLLAHKWKEKRRKCTTLSFSVQANHENHTSFWMSMLKFCIFIYIYIFFVLVFFWWFPSLPPSLVLRWVFGAPGGHSRIHRTIHPLFSDVYEDHIWFNPENPSAFISPFEFVCVPLLFFLIYSVLCNNTPRPHTPPPLDPPFALPGPLYPRPVCCL